MSDEADLINGLIFFGPPCVLFLVVVMLILAKKG
jgi:hypothetical protein